MSAPVVIWIVDDMKNDAFFASEVVEEVASAFRADLGVVPAVLWADGFQWPPFANFRASVDPNAPRVRWNDYPNIVILDLFIPETNGIKLEGNAFYYKLRKWEMSKPGKTSFVLLWSPYQGESAAKPFISDVEKNDQRLIPLATKSSSLLRTKLMELWKRMIEEGDEL
jgi:hypothetical protein